MSMLDPDGNVIELVWRGPEASGELNGDGWLRKLGHVVLWTPNPAPMEEFYNWLGFQVSDRTVRGMSFLRCNADHHTLALVKGNRSGLQHIAFDGESIDNVMRTFGRLKAAGVPCIWGPGKHGPGGNIFTYYKDPAGTVIELYADLEQVPDSDDPVEVKFWGAEHKGDVWGSAGPVPPEFMG
jgi:catechol 2,3-dioxygenase-like lactoylglutathione lyase family enzyme